jgi:hypothetical protein
MPRHSSAPEATMDGLPSAPAAATSRAGPAIRAALIFVAALIACLIAYGALSVPGSWFPRAVPKAWGVGDLALARGTGQIVGDELRVTAPDAEGITLVRVIADLRSTDYAALAWIGIDFPEKATVSVLWRSDYEPNRLNRAEVRIESGRPMPIILAKDPAWIGRITGVALAVRGPLSQPIRLRGVVAKPMGLFETLGDRASEWFAFEGWTGTSINTITGGADIQDLPLPLLLAITVAIAGAVVALIRRRRPAAFATTTTIVAAFFLVSWLLLDARWTWNLASQARVTASQFAGKTAAEKHSAEDDAALLGFIDKALAVLPATPARVIVASDAHYFRNRAAYHLYPHRVYAEPRSNAMQPANMFRPGDWLFVYQRKGIQYDAAQRRLRWDGGQTVSADVKLVEPGGALFLIR